MSAMLMCACAYVHQAFAAINFPAAAAVDMQSLEVFLHSRLFLCKHQNVIKTNRSGFLISFSFLVLLVCFALRNEEKASSWMSFHFHYVRFGAQYMHSCGY